MRKLLGCLCIAFSVFFVVSLSEASLIQNGDFETGSFDPWVRNSLFGVTLRIADSDAESWGMDNYYAALGTFTSEGWHILSQVFDVEGLSELVISFNWFLQYYDTWIPNDTFAAFLTPEGELLETITLLELQTQGTLIKPDIGVAYGRYTENVDISGWDVEEGWITFSLFESSSLLGRDESVLLRTDSLAGVDNVSVAPVPEPATVLLIGSGLIGLAGYRKRLRRK